MSTSEIKRMFRCPTGIWKTRATRSRWSWNQQYESRMVQQTAYGISQYVHTTSLPKRVVIGYDARRDLSSLHKTRQMSLPPKTLKSTYSILLHRLYHRIFRKVATMHCRIIITASHKPAPITAKCTGTTLLKLFAN